MANSNEDMNKKEIIETSFLNKRDFDIVKGRLKFENSDILEGFSPSENDVIAINFIQHSTPSIKELEIIREGDFVPFWLKRFEKEGVTKDELKEGFLQIMN